MAGLPRIASLWIGGQLSWLEQLCLRSFADAGHRITLYSYEPVGNLPDGVESADAAEIYGGTEILRHTRTGSPAIHAEIWRLHLLRQTGAIWVDADMYCYRPFDFDGTHVFGWENPGLVCNAVLALPPDSPALETLLGYFDTETGADSEAGKPGLGDLEWGATGPKALTEALNASGEIEHAQSQKVFYPVSFRDRNKMIMSRFAIEEEWLDGSTRGVHMWARRMKPRLAEKENNRPRRGSFLDGLLRKHGIEPARAVLPGWSGPAAPETRASGAAGIGDAVRLLLDELETPRLTRVVDVGANPLTPPPYQMLLDMGGCDVIGFEPQPDAFAELQERDSPHEIYFPFAVGDGSAETLHIYRDGGLTSIFKPYAGAFTFLGRSRRNIELVEDVALETRALDGVEEIDDFDLLKIDIQGGEVKVFQGAASKLAGAVAVIPEIRFYQIYEDEPMFGGIDLELRQQGFQLHKILEPKTKVIPNSQIDRLKRTEHRNQVVDSDAVYLRDLGQVSAISGDKLKYLSILAAAVFESHDLALFCLDELVRRGAAKGSLPERYVDCLPTALRKA